MSTALTLHQAPDADAIEAVVIGGDLSKLSPAQRVQYYNAVCKSLGLNALTRPFDYITLNGKLTLYARKDAADQLRKLHGISIEQPSIQFQDDWIIVTVSAKDAQGRSDADVAVVNKKDMRGDYGNALMKCVTKAKRRVTLSICGLGMSDETEIETIPGAAPVEVNTQTGEITSNPAAVQVEAIPEPTPEYRTWARDMEVAAKAGVEAFRAAWKASAKAHRDYLQKYESTRLADWKQLTEATRAA